MNPNRMHDRKSFFKYTSADSAKFILRDGTRKWSATSIFNDPFDIPRVAFEGIDETKLHIAINERIKSLILNPIVPDPEELIPQVSVLLNVFSRMSAEHKARAVMAFAKQNEGPAFASEGIQGFRELWHSKYKNHRILCLTEEWDSSSMWDRYSNGHCGVVLEFGCIDELDTATLLARPMVYSNESLFCDTPEGLSELLLYQPTYALRKIFAQYTHTKTTDWAYEREWRIATWAESDDDSDVSFWGFPPQELIGITFGINISSADKAELTALAKTKYPHVMAWQATNTSGRRMTRVPEFGLQ